MGSRELKFLYKETRFNLEPVRPSSIIRVKVLSSQRRSNAHRTSGAGSTVADDEKAYRAKNLATASSVYHRKYHSAPRSFLWRVLENDTVLSLRAVDICKEQREHDANLVLHLQFPGAIRPSCVGFSDSAEHDALCVFVIDQMNQLYSITLRPDVFRKRSALDGGLGDACTSYLPPGFGFKHPHRLVAVTPDQLIITMHDGGILRFDKNKAHDGWCLVPARVEKKAYMTDKLLATNSTLWRETIYNVAGWSQSLRGLMPFQRAPTVRYDKINMELTAATSTAVTSMGHAETAFLFTICLDHRMRVWDVRTGQILYTGDVLNAKRDPQEVGKWTIDPTQSNLIYIVDTSPGQCLVVTFSPISAGEFKFWKVKANDQGSIHVADCFPNDQLIPPSPSMDVWTLADFAVTQNEGGPELWVLWKNNVSYRSQKLQVRPQSAAGPFSDGWKGVLADNNALSVESAGPCDPVDATEKWLDMILYPGRFSKSTIETALIMYEKGLGTYKESPKSGKSLAEAICLVLGATATLDRNSTGGMDYEQFRGTSETQWLRLWRLLLELDKLRGEALSLAVDGMTGMVWVVCADCVGTIRQCSNLERVCHNLQSPEKTSEDVAALVSAGLALIEGFTDSMCQLSRAALQEELYEDSSKSDLERMHQFSDKAGFWRLLTEEDCAVVVENLGQNFRMVTSRLYSDLFDLVSASESSEPLYPLTEFGRKLVVRSVQETAELHWRILFSQLILLVHMEFEFDSEEDALHTRFDVGAIYRDIIRALRRLEHVKWMSKTEMSLPATRSERSGSASGSFSGSFSGSMSGSTSKRLVDEPRFITPLEGLLGHLLGLTDNSEQDLIHSLTDIAVNLCAVGSETELIPYLQQCWLLQLDRPDLASELTPFSDQEPFATYIQGRVSLALKDYDTAAEYFKKASIGLSISTKHVGRHSVGLLDDTEWNLLYSGLPNYYSHIVNLFEGHKAYSYVIEFARIALQFAYAEGVDAAAVKLEMLSRLFTASTAISHFDVAHSTLLAMEDEALQKSYLRKLVERMCESGQNADLVSLPFSGLQTKVDDILLEKCRATKDVLRSVPYHQILYAWRVRHNDYRGGAAILLDRLQKLRQMGEGDKLGADDGMDTQVTQQYLLLINALSCVSPAKEAFILEDVPPGENAGRNNNNGNSNSNNNNKKSNAANSRDFDLENSLDELLPQIDAEAAAGKASATIEEDEDPVLAERMARFARAQVKELPPRRFLTLGDLRKQYQQELDRIVAIQNNQFGLTGDGDADVMDTA